jgi:hypothetical protein
MSAKKEDSMKFPTLNLMAGVLIFVSLFYGSSVASEQEYQGCKLTVDRGSITSMVYSNLATDLKIEKEFLFTMNADGTPAKGVVTFNNGLQRDMKPGEMTLHFEECGGPNTVWDFYKEKGKVATISLDSEKLPYSAFGKASRLTLRSGWKYVGRLAKLADQPDGMSLAVEGASGGPLPFYNNTVATVEQMK